MVLLDREVIFQLILNRLYYSESAYREIIVLLFNSLSENREGFTQREYEGAREARQAMNQLGFLSEWDFESMERLNIIVNCPVNLIFGPDITLLQGTLVRHKPASVVMDYVEIPREILNSRK